MKHFYAKFLSGQFCTCSCSLVSCSSLNALISSGSVSTLGSTAAGAEEAAGATEGGGRWSGPGVWGSIKVGGTGVCKVRVGRFFLTFVFFLLSERSTSYNTVNFKYETNKSKFFFIKV